jgi:hypothetical protein
MSTKKNKSTSGASTDETSIQLGTKGGAQRQKQVATKSGTKRVTNFHIKKPRTKPPVVDIPNVDENGKTTTVQMLPKKKAVNSVRGTTKPPVNTGKYLCLQKGSARGKWFVKLPKVDERGYITTVKMFLANKDDAQQSNTDLSKKAPKRVGYRNSKKKAVTPVRGTTKPPVNTGKYLCLQRESARGKWFVKLPKVDERGDITTVKMFLANNGDRQTK